MANPYHGPDGKFTSKDNAVAAFNKAIYDAVLVDNTPLALSLQADKTNMLEAATEAKKKAADPLNRLPKVEDVTPMKDAYKSSPYFIEGKEFDAIISCLSHIQEAKSLTDEEQRALNILGEMSRILLDPKSNKDEVAEAYKLQTELDKAFPDGLAGSYKDRKPGFHIADAGIYLLARREAYNRKPVVAPAFQQNKGLIGLEDAQKLLVERELTRYWDLPDVQSNIGNTTRRIINGEEPVTMESSRPSTLNEHSVSYILNPEDKTFNTLETNKIYLFQVFPNRELKEVMSRLRMKNVSVSPFFNSREFGLVYSVLTPEGNTRSFSVYEHRNSDSIIINGKTNWDITDQPYGPYPGENQHQFFAEFSYDSRRQVAETLGYFLKSAQKGELEDDVTLMKEAPRLDWVAMLSERLPGFKEWHEKEQKKK